MANLIKTKHHGIEKKRKTTKCKGDVTCGAVCHLLMPEVKSKVKKKIEHAEKNLQNCKKW